MVQELDYLKESAVADRRPLRPYRPGAGRCRVSTSTSRSLAGISPDPNAKGERIRVEGIVIDGIGSPDQGRACWRPGRPMPTVIYAHPEHGAKSRTGFRGWGRVITDFETGEWGLRHGEAGPGDGPLRQADGAAYQSLDRRPRHQYRPQHPALFRGRGRRPTPPIR